MSWRNFLTPYGEKYLVQKDDDHSTSKISQNSYSPIHGMNINKSKSSLDISQTLIQHDISKLLNHNNLPNQNHNNSNNASAKKAQNKSELEDNTYNISYTNSDPFANSSNISYNLQTQQKSSKYENKLAKIKDEMSKLKIELSKFPKKNSRKNSQPTTQTAVKTEGNFRRVSNENINPIMTAHRQSLQSIKNENPLNQQQLMYINHHRNSLQQLKSGQDLSMTNRDELSFSQNRQLLDHDSFITEDDIQQISDSLQDHLSNYNKFQDKLNAVHMLNGQLAQQYPQNAISQLTTAHLTSLTPTQQNTINKQSLTTAINTVRQSSDKEIQTLSYREQDNVVSTHQQDHQKSTEHQKISILKHDRNQLLEALENVLKVISKDKSKNSDTKQINQLKDHMKQLKKTKKSFKYDLNSLRQEFLDIGHIEPLNLSYKKELDNLANYQSIQSQPKSSVKNSPNSFNEKYGNILTTTTPQYYFMPLQQNKNNNNNTNSNNLPIQTNNNINSNAMPSNNITNQIFSNTQNYNNTIGNTKLNTSNLLQTEDVSFRQNVPIPLHLSQKSLEMKQKIQTSPQPSYLMNNNSSIMNTNGRSNFNQTHQNNENKSIQNNQQQQYPPLSLMEQYKQQQKQQIDRQQSSDNSQKYAHTPTNKQSLTPRKQQDDTYSRENVFNTRISPNQLFKQQQQQHTSPPNKDFNQTNLESNYQTFQQTDHLDQPQQYQQYYEDQY